MQVRRRVEPALHQLHLFLYGPGGAGKSRFITDFHKRGQNIVVFTTENLRMTYDIELDEDIPYFLLDSFDEFCAVIENPEYVIEKLLEEHGFKGYSPKTIAFEGIKGFQQLYYGHEPRPAVKIFDGLIKLPPRKPAGVLAKGLKDGRANYRLLDDTFRGAIFRVDKMPYHTIVTAHDDLRYTEETKMKLTGDPKIDMDVRREIQGGPKMMGFALQNELPNLISDFFLHLEKDLGNRYWIEAHHSKLFRARTRLGKRIPSRVDWTDKNGYDLLMGYLKEVGK